MVAVRTILLTLSLPFQTKLYKIESAFFRSSLKIGMADALKISLGMAKVLTIYILPKSDKPLHFHKFRDISLSTLKFLYSLSHPSLLR